MLQLTREVAAIAGAFDLWDRAETLAPSAAAAAGQPALAVDRPLELLEAAKRALDAAAASVTAARMVLDG